MAVTLKFLSRASPHVNAASPTFMAAMSPKVMRTPKTPMMSPAAAGSPTFWNGRELGFGSLSAPAGSPTSRLAAASNAAQLELTALARQAAERARQNFMSRQCSDADAHVWSTSGVSVLLGREVADSIHGNESVQRRHLQQEAAWVGAFEPFVPSEVGKAEEAGTIVEALLSVDVDAAPTQGLPTLLRHMLDTAPVARPSGGAPVDTEDSAEAARRAFLQRRERIAGRRVASNRPA